MGQVYSNILRGGRATSSHLYPHKGRAYTLLEMTMVVGVVGAVLAGVFQASTLILYRNQVNQASDELYQISSNVRNLYAGIPLPTVSWCADIRSLLPNTYTQIFPSEMIQNTSSGLAINNPWGGAVILSICGGNTVSPESIMIEYDALPSAACEDLAVRNSLPGRDTGLFQMIMSYNRGGTVTLSGTSLPVNPVTAMTSCANTANGNKIVWYYRLNN